MKNMLMPVSVYGSIKLVRTQFTLFAIVHMAMAMPIEKM